MPRHISPLVPSPQSRSTGAACVPPAGDRELLVGAEQGRRGEVAAGLPVEVPLRDVDRALRIGGTAADLDAHTGAAGVHVEANVENLEIGVLRELEAREREGEDRIGAVGCVLVHHVGIAGRDQPRAVVRQPLQIEESEGEQGRTRGT